MEMTNLTSSMKKGFLLILLIFTDMPKETRQDDMVLRTFGSVIDVDIGNNVHMLTKNQAVSTKMRCTSLCIQLGCECTSFVHYNKTCYMFAKALITGNGNNVGYNKITECATPRQIPDATLQTYTGCNATYGCNFGYTSSASSDSNTITCQEDETWTPSDYECTQKPCPSPPSLTNGHSTVTSYQVGGVATYGCDTNFFNIGGGANTLTCVLGGTWSGNIDMVCAPTTATYTISIQTGYVARAGTDADVYLKVFGQWGNFGITFPSSMEFEQGDLDVFTGTFGNVDILTSITIGHNNALPNAEWYLESVRIDVSSNYQRSYTWTVKEWIETGKLERSLVVENSARR